ncbi:MAG: GNAT family N-acetyltransferase [Sneathiella sp.]|nr:GNAT family N-acetyltransferase [Sneathiella sp.]
MLKNLLGTRRPKTVFTERLYIRAPEPEDWGEWSSVREESRPHLIPWEPVWQSDCLTQRSFRDRIRRYSNDARADAGYAFFLFRRDDNKLVGSITVGNVRRGVAQTGTMGYWTGLPYIRSGYMYEAITGLLPVLFNDYQLRRIEAACLPENVPSASLLQKAGFSREGYARQYLCINGIWQDHLLFAILKGDPIGSNAQHV